MFRDENKIPIVMRRLAALDLSAIAGIFSENKADEAAKLGHQEFGTKRGVPQRQTVAPAFDQGQDTLMAMVAGGVDAVIAGTKDAEEAMDTVGKRMAAQIRRNIRGNPPPPLAPSTLARRRARGNTSTRRLVDSGDMLAAVEHAVVTGETPDG